MREEEERTNETFREMFLLYRRETKIPRERRWMHDNVPRGEKSIRIRSKRIACRRASLTFCRPEALIYGTRRPYRCPINAPVEEEHDEHRDVEASESAVHHISGVVGELAGPRTLHVGGSRFSRRD